MKGLSFLMGEAEWQQLMSAVQKIFAKVTSELLVASYESNTFPPKNEQTEAPEINKLPFLRGLMLFALTQLDVICRVG